MTLTEMVRNPNIIASVLFCMVAFLLYRLILKILHKQLDNSKQYYKIKRGLTYGIWTLAFVGLGIIWLEIGAPIGTYLGLISAGIAVALKDLIINIAAWAFIVTKRPFIVGDRIEIDGQIGDVIDQRIFQFSMIEVGNWVDNDQSTGRILHVPNSKIFIDSIANYTTGFAYIWNEISILLTFESDWRAAKTQIESIATKHTEHTIPEIEKAVKMASRKYYLFYKNVTPIVYTSVKGNGVQLTMRYLCEPHRRRSTEAKIWEDLLDMIAADDRVQLAYDTIRVTQQ